MANDPDFDSLRHLAETSPQAYFAERTRLIEEFLSGVPPERARALRVKRMKMFYAGSGALAGLFVILLGAEFVQRGMVA